MRKYSAAITDRIQTIRSLAVRAGRLDDQQAVLLLQAFDACLSQTYAQLGVLEGAEDRRRGVAYLHDAALRFAVLAKDTASSASGQRMVLALTQQASKLGSQELIGLAIRHWHA